MEAKRMIEKHKIILNKICEKVGFFDLSKEIGNPAFDYIVRGFLLSPDVAKKVFGEEVCLYPISDFGDVYWSGVKEDLHTWMASYEHSLMQMSILPTEECLEYYGRYLK